MRVVFLIILVHLTFVVCEPRERRQARCSGTSFRCNNGQCISLTSVCDGTVNCRDRSDETQAVCSKLSLQCPSYAFRCAYGACIDKVKKCNGAQDCADNSDELAPECSNKNANITKISNGLCKQYEFACTSGECIKDVLVCDGDSNCRDGSDETITQCINIRCPAFSFQCAYGACIDKIKKCDGKDDCKDGSDEDPELCISEVTTTTTTTRKPAIISKPQTNPYGGCPLPGKPEGGDYTVNDCDFGDFSDKCRKVPGTIVRPNVVLSFSCDNGFVLPEHRQNSFCRNGVWEPEVPQCQKLCKGLHSDSLTLTCYYGGDPVDCREPARPRTRLDATCKDSYHFSDPSTTFTTTECLPNGKWGSELYQCVPDCGKRNLASKIKPAIIGGNNTAVSEYPWHSGLYELSNGIPTYICGGSIVSPKAILTAAHCVFNESSSTNKHVSLIKVVVGKYKSDWNIRDPDEQRFGVSQIIIQSKYYGKGNRYEQDIAIVEVDRMIVISNVVMPICFDRDEILGLYKLPNSVGTVVGWGITETGQISEDLMVATFPTYDFLSCRTKLGDSYLAQYITYDKFCAGRDDGTSVQSGDSGGALTFAKNIGSIEQHYVYGIVSLKPADNDKIAAFTNVTEHMRWIDKVLFAIKQSQSKIF